jgi:ABC-type transport system involved in cytochrome bd biosynthesis fused ATPase/permease subunit
VHINLTGDLTDCFIIKQDTWLIFKKPSNCFSKGAQPSSYLLPMLMRDFLSARKGKAAIIVALGLAAGGWEGGFVLLGKALAAGSLHVTLAAQAAALFLLVTLRSLSQMASAVLESQAVSGWIGERRRAVLDLGLGRDWPAHRAPFREAWAGVLGAGLDRLGEGVMAGLRCQAALAQGAVLLPMLFIFSWKPAVAALALAVPALLVSRFRARTLEAAARRWSDSQSDAAVAVEEFAEGLESFVGNGGLSAGAARLSESLRRHERQSRRWENSRAIFPPALEWFFFAALAGLFWLVTALHAAGPASLLPFAALLLLLYRPIREWARNFPVYLLGEGSWKDLLGLEGSLRALPPRRLAGAAPGETLVLRGIRFGYSPGFGRGPGRQILDGFDLQLDAGALTLVSGPNGAGKSTLLKLIAGVESQQQGALLLPARITSFGYLPQRVFVEPLFREWLAAFGKENPAAWERLDGILGLESIMRKAGGGRAWASGLSGGERQRLGLGRVFASGAQYLLLDEPTTFLAAGDRERILGELLDLWKGGETPRGALIVSHEPFLAEFCSRTVRIESGIASALREEKT